MTDARVTIRTLADERPPHRADEGFTLGDGELDLWLMRSPSPETAHLLDRSVLDAAEHRQADSFIRPADGLLYATVHVALRRLLGRYLHTAPQDVRFTRESCPGCGGSHGRPALDMSPLPLHFSLSHSSAVALIGVATTPLGVDVERLPRAETIDVCTGALHPQEQAELADHDAESERAEAFGRIWARKEAYLKGIGTGLSRSPAKDYLGGRFARHPAGWTVFDVPCTTTHAAAAAVRGAAPLRAGVRWLDEGWLRAGPQGGVHTTPDERRVVTSLAC
ncbi:4'-phosphopantetheinyl transferase family protein [Kitasatospora sp. NPDC056531]|uniref:4'-phosphopantetheinyl transferase family protein n=1 Tax=Kitasatospora sp. NPDC056531 TaxID=3345856 RepID=UPI0036BAB285